jgi:hypothetical protein
MPETILLMRDGNQIVALIGRDLQLGVDGYGDTAVAALRDLASRMEAENYQIPRLDLRHAGPELVR